MKVNCDLEGIAKAVKMVENGGVIVFPTDTVYGIGCNPYNKEAIQKIYNIKSREETKSLPVLVYSIEIASAIVKFDEYSKKIAEKFWPGPLTLILKLKDMKLKNSLNLGEKIALRVPNNTCALELLKRCNLLIGTSANISGEEPYTDASKCYENLVGFDLFVDGGKILGSPSTIIEIDNGNLEIKRQGILTKEDILKVL